MIKFVFLQKYTSAISAKSATISLFQISRNKILIMTIALNNTLGGCKQNIYNNLHTYNKYNFRQQ